MSTIPTPPYGDLFADLTYSTVLPTGYASGYLMSDVASAALYSGWAPLMSPMFSGSVTVDGYAVINQYLDVWGSINASGSLSVSGSIYTSGAITASGSVTASWATSSGQLATLAQVQAQSTNYAPDTGMVNALAVTLNPAPSSCRYHRHADPVKLPIRTPARRRSTSTGLALFRL